MKKAVCDVQLVFPQSSLSPLLNYPDQKSGFEILSLTLSLSYEIAWANKKHNIFDTESTKFISLFLFIFSLFFYIIFIRWCWWKGNRNFLFRIQWFFHFWNVSVSKCSWPFSSVPNHSMSVLDGFGRYSIGRNSDGNVSKMKEYL